MKWWFRRRAGRQRDLDDEIAFDLAAETEEQIRSGMTPRDAELASRRDFGSVLLAKELTRETWGWGAFERLVQDARYALRRLARSPAFTAVAVASLALGIGANTAIFTLINLVMLKSLPVRSPEQLVRISVAPPAGAKSGLTQSLWEQLRDRQDFFSSLFAYGSTHPERPPAGDCRRHGTRFLRN
jgi:hypothetical protein